MLRAIASSRASPAGRKSTGLRGETRKVAKMAERVDFDLGYVNNWSFTLDVKILCRTLILGLHARAY